MHDVIDHTYIHPSYTAEFFSMPLRSSPQVSGIQILASNVLLIGLDFLQLSSIDKIPLAAKGKANE